MSKDGRSGRFMFVLWLLELLVDDDQEARSMLLF
jgi:hypothetical protein